MPRRKCPECDEVVKVPEGSRAVVRCPACDTRIRIEQSEDEDAEDRDETRSTKPRRKPASEPDPIHGLIALLILGPIGLALAIGGIFNVKLAFAGTIVGFIGLCVAVLCLRGLYQRYARRFAREDGDEETWYGYISRIGLAFRRPRVFGSWTFLEVLFSVILFEGLILVVLLPMLGVHPHGKPGQNDGGNQQPGVVPNQPAPGPNPPEISPEDRTITRCLADLDKPDDFSRRASAATLAGLKPKPDRQAEVVKKLTERVDDPNDGVRYQTTLALGVWGGPEDVPTLVRLMNSQDGLTRDAAVIAVRRFRDVRAIPGLIHCLQDAGASKTGIAALVEIGPAAEKDLIKEISNKDSPVLGAAIAVLKDIGTPDSLPALRALANDPKKAYVAQLVRAAIKQINARAKKGAG